MERSMAVISRVLARTGAATVPSASSSEESSAWWWFGGAAIVFAALVSETALTLVSLGVGVYVGYMFIRFAVSETRGE